MDSQFQRAGEKRRLAAGRRSGLLSDLVVAPAPANLPPLGFLRVEMRWKKFDLRLASFLIVIGHVVEVVVAGGSAQEASCCLTPGCRAITGRQRWRRRNGFGGGAWQGISFFRPVAAGRHCVIWAGSDWFAILTFCVGHSSTIGSPGTEP